MHKNYTKSVRSYSVYPKSLQMHIRILHSERHQISRIAQISEKETTVWRLLRAIIVSDTHVLRRHYFLRPRPYPFQLPAKDDRSFIPRALLKLKSNSSVSKNLTIVFSFLYVACYLLWYVSMCY